MYVGMYVCMYVGMYEYISSSLDSKACFCMVDTNTVLRRCVGVYIHLR